MGEKQIPDKVEKGQELQETVDFTLQTDVERTDQLSPRAKLQEEQKYREKVELDRAQFELKKIFQNKSEKSVHGAVVDAPRAKLGWPMSVPKSEVLADIESQMERLEAALLPFENLADYRDIMQSSLPENAMLQNSVHRIEADLRALADARQELKINDSL